MKPLIQRLTILLILITESFLPLSTVAQDHKAHFSFAFMTDIHVQPEKNGDKGFLQAIQHVNRLKPDFVITGGDLIMDALEQKQSRADSLYQLYLNCSKSFAIPVYNTMGNHEIFGLYPSSGIDPAHDLYGKKMFEKYIGKPFYSFDHKGWHFMVIDGISFTPEREYIGRIDSLQMAWIKQDLAAVESSTPICVSSHIPFLTVMNQIEEGPFAPVWPGLVIGNSREALALFRNHNLKLVLQGHLHFLESITCGGTTFITGGTVCGSWWEGPNRGLEEGYLMIDVDGDSFTWRYEDDGWEVNDKHFSRPGPVGQQ